MKRLAALVAALLITACGYSVAQTGSPSDPYFDAPTAIKAGAGLLDSKGSPVGFASFSDTRLGVLVDLKVVGLPKGAHGVHIHAVGKCDRPDFATAGAHFNPSNARHGLHNLKGPHAGDLPNLVVGDDGSGSLRYVDPLISLESGASNSILGLSLVVHANVDDEVTDPSGNSGGRIACGLIAKPT